MSLNEVKLIGYLGEDPEMRVTPNGKDVATLSVATSSNYANVPNCTWNIQHSIRYIFN